MKANYSRILKTDIKYYYGEKEIIVRVVITKFN